MATKFYAVKVGLKPGIYLTWPECEINVKGYPGAIYKSFTQRPDAESFMGNASMETAKPKKVTNPIPKKDDEVPVIYDNANSKTSDGMKKVTIYTDGSARGNPDGPGGYGCVIEYVDLSGQMHVKEHSGGFKKTTNNRMELMAAIVALEALKESCDVLLVSDSQYMIKAFNENWIAGWIKKGWTRGKNEPVKNSDLWKRMLKAKQPHKVTFKWVKGHNGHPQNERCDVLATNAADGNVLADDAVGN